MASGERLEQFFTKLVGDEQRVADLQSILGARVIELSTQSSRPYDALETAAVEEVTHSVAACSDGYQYAGWGNSTGEASSKTGH